MFDLTNKKITIIGAKRSGQAMAKLVRASIGRAAVSEKSDVSAFTDDFKSWMEQNNVRFEGGGHTQTFMEDSDVVVLSPGARLDSPPAQWAKVKGIPVMGEIEFAFQFCPVPVIAVTGSNGKTTVVTLIHQVLQASGFKACLCGNVGSPFSEHVLNLKGKDYVVLEVSSFQLESMLNPAHPLRQRPSSDPFHVRGFQPFIAVILNLSQNHLDRHKDMEEYFQAKSRMLMNQTSKDFAVLNYADDRLRTLAGKGHAQKIFFNQPSSLVSETTNPNHLAVLEVAKILGIAPQLCHQVFRDFKGVEHRCEKVRELEGVDFINDAKSTTTEATRWALTRAQQPVVLICGGRDKNVDFSVLKDIVRDKVKKMIVIGEARPKISRTFQGVVDLEECATLQEAVEAARHAAVSGDCVLLSPMCTSFDMFSNFEERGKVFKEIVKGLP